MSQGQGAPGKNGGPGSNHPRRPAHRLGIINYLCTKGKWWASLMSRSAWPQQTNPLWSPQDTYCRRSCTWICKFALLHQARCTSWILVNSPWQRIKPLNYLQQPLWEVPFPASSLWSGLFTGHLPEEGGPVPWRVPLMYQNCQWYHCTWSHWGRTWCPPAEPHAGSLQVWSCVQSTENTHQGPSHQLLWLPIQCQWCPPRPGEGWCCACSPSTHKCHWTPRVPQHGDISSPFVPGLSTLTAPLQELLKKDTNFTWNASYEATFQQVKQAVVSDTTLGYFDPSLPVTIQVNASQVGLGAALLQNNKPVAFTSKTLTNAECRYINIEREMLAVVFGAERFHTYIYGQSFMIESDHKPLESISRKNLADMPAWLQCMMLHLQGYDLTICYCPGMEMVIPDTLSIQSPARPNFPLHIAIHHARIMPDCKEAFQQTFISNLEMRALADLIITGWPEDIKEVPCPLHLYWQHRETLTIGDGLVLWGEALIIPPTERERVLHQLHQFHQGIMKSQLLACGSFFWPSINKAIEEVVCQCETCTQFQSQNAAVPLTPTPTPSCPWQMCATDIFMLEGVDHLVVGNFYLKMIFIQHIPPSQSNANKVVSLLKEMFSEHGIPKVLHSDNGPQYVSAQFADFCISWAITHKSSSLHYPQSNGFTESCIKSVKHPLQWAKCSSANPQLTLLALWATPIDTNLPSPAELLYQCWLKTTILAKIHNNDPSSIQVCEQIDTWSEVAKSQTDKHSKALAPLYAGQPVAMYDTLRKIWVPATVICVLPWNSYQVCTSSGSTYCHMQRHLCEHSVKVVNTVPSGTTATLQAPTRHCFSAAQPALPQPAQHM